MNESPEAGWYDDPTPGSTQLRYWDGSQWTEQYTDAPSYANTQGAQDPAATAYQQVQPDIQQTSQSADEFVAAQQYQQYGQQSQQSQYGQQYQQYNQQYTQQYGQQYAPVDDNKTNLKMVAFIFNIISTVSIGWLIIPLAWMIPMTVYSWGIYKGTKKNTTAFSVCCLIFVSLVSGILLLVAGEDK